MKVRFLVGVGGDDFSRYPGEVVDLPDEEAEKWADGIRAELVEEEPEPTTEKPPKKKR